MRIHYPAVVVSAVVYFLIGGAWYTALFGQRWMAAVGMTEAQLAAGGVAEAYSIAFVCNLVVAYVMAALCHYTGSDTAAKGAKLGLLTWFGFVLTNMMMNYAFERQSSELLMINAGYALVGMVITGVILGAWRKKTVSSS